MDITREIYWNVGHGPLTLIPMYLLTIAAIGVIVRAFRERIQVYRQGGEAKRTDQVGARLRYLLQNVLLQKKVARVRMPGLFHGLFFWAFLLLLLGTTLIVVQADVTDLFFKITFLKGTFYRLFSLTLDLAGLVALVMLGCLSVRRYIFPPVGLVTSSDDAVMHILMVAILLSGFIIEGCRMAVTEMGTPLADWSPVGYLFASFLASFSEERLRLVHTLGWWLHLVLVMGFLMLIPYSKFRHILTTSASYFFADRGPKGKLVSLDLEQEDADNFGAAKIAELSWKDILDTDACTLCQRCQDRCPAYATGKPLSPMQVVNSLERIAFTSPEANLIETIGKDALWSCTTCRACQEICPAGIEHVPKIVEMRRNMVLMEGEFPGDEVMTAMEQTEVNGNPLGIGYASRGDWAETLGLAMLSEDPDVDILYFVGCYGSFDKRNVKVAKSFVQLCKAAGLKVGILGKEEKCCGEPMRKMGNEYLYQTLATENVGLLMSYAPKKIVTTCPHCFNTLAKDYRDLGLTISVEHYTTFIEHLLVSGSLNLKPEVFSCTYHDSCYLGRHNDIYEAPRSLIRAAGGIVSEMSRNREEAFCCSAGGGRIMAEEKIGERINLKRVQMAVETETKMLLSSCPFCLTMFEDGVKGAGVEDTLRPRDIAELLCEQLQ